MRSVIFPISALLVGIGILLIGNGLLGLQLGLRAGETFGESITGFVMAGYFIGFVAGSFLVPHLVRSVGYIRTFAAMAALASIAAVTYGVFVDPIVWWLLRLLSGFCLVGIYLVVESWLNEQAPSDQRGKIFGIYMVVTLVALDFGLVLGPVAGDPTHLETYVLASVLFSLGLIPVAVTPMPQPHPVASPATGFRRLFVASPTGFLGSIIAGVVNGILWGLGPAFWRGLGLSETEAGLFMAAVLSGGVLLQWPIGHLSDGHDRRRVLAAVSLAAALTAMLTLLALEHSKSLLAVCAFIYGGLMLTVYSLSVAHVNDRIAQSQILEASRTLLLLYGIGAALGPMAAGPFMEIFGPAALPVFCATALVLLALVSVQQMFAKAPVPPAEQGVFVPLTRTSQVVVEMLPEASSAASDQETPVS